MTIGSQYGQDRILKMIFRDKHTGFVVEVGAADGIDNSNSYMLLQRPHWGGILIEPESSQFALLQERYKNNNNVKCIRCACGAHEGIHTLYRGGQVSTFKLATKAAAEDMHNIKYEEEQVEIKTLQRVLTENNAPTEIDYMSIDCEGMDREVWGTLELDTYRPGLVCMEGKGHVMIGYQELCRTPGNTFYLREDLCEAL